MNNFKTPDIKNLPKKLTHTPEEKANTKAIIGHSIAIFFETFLYMGLGTATIPILFAFLDKEESNFIGIIVGGIITDFLHKLNMKKIKQNKKTKRIIYMVSALLLLPIFLLFGISLFLIKENIFIRHSGIIAYMIAYGTIISSFFKYSKKTSNLD